MIVPSVLFLFAAAEVVSCYVPPPTETQKQPTCHLQTFLFGVTGDGFTADCHCDVSRCGSREFPFLKDTTDEQREVDGSRFSDQQLGEVRHIQDKLDSV